jgi:hypothetical protein
MARKKSSRSRKARGSTTKTSGIKTSEFAPMRISIPVQPTPSEVTVKIRKLLQINVPIGESGNVAVSPSMLSAGLVGGLTYWKVLQIDSIRVYSDAAAEASNLLTVSISPSSSWAQPNLVIKDSGTVGNERARIGFRLGLLDRARWFGTASTEELFVASASPDETIIVQALVTVISSGI